MPKPSLDLIQQVVEKAKAAGADAADALAVEGRSLSVTVRNGKLEDIERAEAQDFGLRVFVGHRQAIVSSSDFSDDAINALVERVVDMAKVAPEDSDAILPDAAQQGYDPALDLDLLDKGEVSEETIKEHARRAEAAGLVVKGITNSEGGGASVSKSQIYLLSSTGFSGHYRTSSHSLYATLIAGDDTGMERDYDYSSTRHFEDLESPETIGRSAGERTVKRLNARKPDTGAVPIIFSPRVSNSLLGHFLQAINGEAISRGTSFLKNQMGKQIFGKGVAISDDPLRIRGLRSKPFDGEGIATRKLQIIVDGRLESWILDCTNARKLGLATTGHASRGIAGRPSPQPTNVFLHPGQEDPEALMDGIESGFYITELIGMGVNPVTGDYSRGATGFWIEGGKISYPVNEVSIAGNLKDMFKALIPANDLEFRYGIDAPTIRIDGMTVAGN